MPKSEAKALNIDAKPITVTINAEGQLFLQEDEITEADLVTRLTALTEAGAGLEERVLVRGDRQSNYGLILKIMGTISAAGYTKIGLLSINENGG